MEKVGRLRHGNKIYGRRFFEKKNFFVVSVPLHPDLHDLPSQNHSRACT